MMAVKIIYISSIVLPSPCSGPGLQRLEDAPSRCLALWVA